MVIVDDASVDGTREVLADAVAARRPRADRPAPRRLARPARARATPAGAPRARRRWRSPTTTAARRPAGSRPGVRAHGEHRQRHRRGDRAGPHRAGPREAHRLGPFTRSLNVPKLDHWYATANMFYARATLERLGGFDEDDVLPAGRRGHRSRVARDRRRRPDSLQRRRPRLARRARARAAPAPAVRHALGRDHGGVRSLSGAAPADVDPRAVLEGVALPPRAHGRGAGCSPAGCGSSARTSRYRYALLLWRRAHWHGDGKGGGPLLVPYYLRRT